MPASQPAAMLLPPPSFGWAAASRRPAEALLGGDWAGERRDEHGRVRADRWHWTGRHPDGGGHRLGEDRPGVGAKRLDGGDALRSGRALAASRKLPVYALSGVFRVAEPRTGSDPADPGGDGIEFFQSTHNAELTFQGRNVGEGDGTATAIEVTATGTIGSGGATFDFELPTILQSLDATPGPACTGGTDYTSTLRVTLPAGTNPTASLLVTVCDDSTDEPTETIRLAVDTDTLPAGVTLASGESGSKTARIRDDDPTVVTLGSLSGRVFEDDTDDPEEFTVTLGRALAPGETAKVRLAFTWEINDAKTPAVNTFVPSASGVGVTWDNGHTVTFTRPSGGDTDGDGTVDSDDTVQTATVTVTPDAGEDGNTRDDSITYEVNSLFTSTAAAGIAGGIAGSGPQTFAIIDAGEVLVWTEAVPLTKQPDGWPALDIAAHPLVDDTSGKHNYWLGRDLWIEPGASPHVYYLWLTKPAHEDVLLYLSSPNSDNLISLSETGNKTQSHTVTISAGDGPCTGSGSTRVFYGGPNGCAIGVYVHRSIAAHQSGCRHTRGSADNSVFGDGVDTKGLGSVRVALPQTHANAGDTERDWTTTRNSRANAYKTGGVCHAAGGRITPDKPRYPS